MRRFTFSCDPCGVSFDTTVEAGAPTPTDPPCPQCGEASQRCWVAPTAIVRGSEMEITEKGALPHFKEFDAYGRSAAKLESDHQKFLKAKRDFHRRTSREAGTTRRKGGIRHIGSVPMHQLIAHQRETGDKHVMTRDPVGFLKRTNNHFED